MRKSRNVDLHFTNLDRTINDKIMFPYKILPLLEIFEEALARFARVL